MAQAWTEARIRQYYAPGGCPAFTLSLSDDCVVGGAATAPPASGTATGCSDSTESARGAASQPGGGVPQPEQPEQDPGNAPAVLQENMRAATKEGYRAAAIADGIPFR